MVVPIALIIMATMGPFWAAIIVSVSTFKIKHRKEHYIYKFIFNRAMFFLTGAASALTYQYLISNLNIELESEEGIGSTFIIELPIYKLEQEEINQMEHLNDLVELEFSDI